MRIASSWWRRDERLTADDLVNIQRWRRHPGAIVDYRAPEA
jgi:hypothetical protein